jgi:hypothetical protein
MSQNVTILGHWNSRKAKSLPSLSWGEERTKILLLACCYQEGLSLCARYVSRVLLLLAVCAARGNYAPTAPDVCQDAAVLLF